jgi:hypothetical protein
MCAKVKQLERRIVLCPMELSSKGMDLKEGVDYEIDGNGLLVFTRQYLLKRGYCCKNGCRNCPYGFKKKNAI